MTARTRIVTIVGAVAAVTVITTSVIVGLAARSSEPPATQGATPTATPTPTVDPFAADGGLQDPTEVVPVADVGRPTVVRIPRLGIESTLEDLAVGAAGELSAPVDFDRAGWFTGGPRPGQVGPAIIAGHVDSATGPAIFKRLGELQDGDEVIVDTDAGTSLTFVVTGRMQSAKATFPTADVYANVPRPELRLITCAGSFDRSIGHYTDNLIVFAALSR